MCSWAPIVGNAVPLLPASTRSALAPTFARLGRAYYTGQVAKHTHCCCLPQLQPSGTVPFGCAPWNALCKRCAHAGAPLPERFTAATGYKQTTKLGSKRHRLRSLLGHRPRAACRLLVHELALEHLGAALVQDLGRQQSVAGRALWLEVQLAALKQREERRAHDCRL